jgi:hypothetical protein
MVEEGEPEEWADARMGSARNVSLGCSQGDRECYPDKEATARFGNPDAVAWCRENSGHQTSVLGSGQSQLVLVVLPVCWGMNSPLLLSDPLLARYVKQTGGLKWRSPMTGFLMKRRSGSEVGDSMLNGPEALGDLAERNCR